MKHEPGRVRRALAALLQKSFPDTSAGLKLTWEAEQVYPATGRYRTDWRLDCARWEAFARHYRDDGTYFNVWSVHSYATMTELIKCKALEMSPDGEISPATP